VGLFEHAVLSNVGWAAALAVGAAITSRLFAGRPALAHGLWVLVLLKLVTPPVLYLAYQSESTAASSWTRLETATTGSIMASSPAETELPVTTLPAAAPVNPSTHTESIALEGTSTGSGDDLAPSPAPLQIAETSDPVSPRHGLTWRHAAFLLWSMGTFAWLTAVVLQIVRFRQLVRAAKPAPADVRERTSWMAVRLGLRRTPDVLMIPAPARIPPMVWALASPPRLLLPEGLWSQLDAAQQETVLAHELAHLRRRDHWVRWLEAVALGLYWWNPIAWWARRQVERAEEQCCDAWVVWALPDSVESYAEALVATTAFLSGSRVACPVGATGIGTVGAGRVAELRKRLTMILNESGLGGIARPASRLALVAAAIALWLLPGWAPAQPDTPLAPVPKTSLDAASDTSSAPTSQATTESPKLGAATPPAADAPARVSSNSAVTDAPPAADAPAKLPSNVAATDTPPATAAPKVRPANSAATDPALKEFFASRSGEMPPVVDVVQPIAADVVDHYDFVGRVEAAAAVEIRSQASGALTKVHDAAGGIVEKGSLLFEIDPRSYEAELRKAQAEVVRCEAQLKSRTVNLDRIQRLRKTNATSDQEVDKVSGERDEAAAALAIAQPTLELARLKLEGTRIIAPIRGRLGGPRLAVGELVSAETTLLATIDSDDPMLVAFDIPQDSVLKLLRVQAGTPMEERRSGLSLLNGLPVILTVREESGRERTGRITSTDGRIDPDKGTLRCRATVSNEDGFLLPGLFAQVRVHYGAAHRVLLVPQTAITIDGARQLREGRTLLFTVNEEGVITENWVELGRSYQDKLWSVLNGVAETDWVVRKPESTLSAGLKVSPRKPESSAAPPPRTR